MKKKSRIKIKNQNTKLIEKYFKDLNEEKINGYVDGNLFNYLSFALRINQYYGNLSIKYISFNFTFVAFFTAFLTFFFTFLKDLNPSLWYTSTPLMIGVVSYFLYFITLLIIKYDTISFDHVGLQHYSSIMRKEDYPKLTEKHLTEFMILIKNDKINYSIKDDLKTLVLYYLYQANYQVNALRLRKCLIIGFGILIGTVITSLIWYALS